MIESLKLDIELRAGGKCGVVYRPGVDPPGGQPTATPIPQGINPFIVEYVSEAPPVQQTPQPEHKEPMRVINLCGACGGGKIR